MNKLTCTLLSGASVVALVFAGDMGGMSARAATAPGPGAYSTGGTDVDYIIITGDLTGTNGVTVTNGDQVNGPAFDGPNINTPFGGTYNGLFGIVNAATTGGPATGVTVGGAIINNGTIIISETGVSVARLSVSAASAWILTARVSSTTTTSS